MTLTAGTTVQVVASVIPQDVDTSLLSFSIFDKSTGSLVLRRNSGTAFSQGDVLGSFIASGVQSSQKNLVGGYSWVGSTDESEAMGKADSVEKTADGHIIAISVLSVLLGIFIISTVYLGIKNKNKRKEGVNRALEPTVGSTTDFAQK